MTISLIVVFVGMAFMSFGVYWAGTFGRTRERAGD